MTIANLLSTACLLAIVLPGILSPGLLAAAERPNILFIIADDQSPFDFKFYNPESTLDAPTIEKLAAEGMVLDGAY